MKKAFIFIMIILIISIGFNVFLVNYIGNKNKEGVKYDSTIVFKNANSRDTYFSIHNVKKAQAISKGSGIKVGIIDQYFGFKKHPDLYAGGKDFSGNLNVFHQVDEHGYWMALVLKEIAPDVEIYALNISFEDEEQKTENMVKAIDWAIDHDLDVLTYSSSRFLEENKKKLDEAVDKAMENNIVTTFIHYDHNGNILPDGFFAYRGLEDYNSRKPDLNIYHFDYNTLFLKDYFEYKNKNPKESVGYIPYLSISSTSPVAAGFVALLKGINNNLKPSDYKKILIDTSKKIDYGGVECSRVVDIYQAVKYISDLK